MPSDLKFHERRRGDRVMLRVPVKIHGLARDNKHATEDAETVVLSRHGALLRCHAEWKMGSILDITNGFTNQCEKFRVVWIGDQAKQGYHDVGVEMLIPHDEFWGIKFPATLQKA
jgi:hypothetical protein